MTKDYKLLQQTAPALEPVNIEEVKTFLRIDGEDEEGNLNILIKSARILVESYLKKSIIFQQWKMIFEDYAPAEVKLPRGPITNIISVSLVDKDGNVLPMNPDFYYLSPAQDKLIFNTTVISHAVEIIYEAGMATNNLSVPKNIKLAVLNIITASYENKGLPANLNELCKILLAGERILEF
jgi:uncharacterized phiE125 gp8 family phage protein